MKNTIFTGAGCAIVTPMNEDCTVNYEKLKELIEFQVTSQTDAIIIAGTTGEASTFTDQEHIDVIKCAVDVVNKRIPVIAGTGSNDTLYSIELSKEAQKLGADALLQVTPYYNKTSQSGLIKHFSMIADSVDLPIVLYNVPSRTGMSISVNTYVELAKHKNIVATKEASGNISLVAEIASACGDCLDIYSGNDDQIVPIMSLGGKGVISVVSNVMPKETHDICNLYLQGETTKARELQLKLLPLINALFSDVNPIPVKAALNSMGKNVGPCRLPLDTINEAAQEKLLANLKKFSLI